MKDREIKAFQVQRDEQVRGEEVTNLLTEIGEWGPYDAQTWDKAIETSLCVVTARLVSDEKLIGIGFLAGNSRHAQLVDMNVHPDFRQRGIGRQLQEIRLAYAHELGIRYIGLTRDPKKPWLHEFYESTGFRDIDFAMWQEDSIKQT